MNEPYTVRRGLWTWWRDALRHRRTGHALGRLVIDIYDMLRDLTPARRRLRFGDLEYDFEHGVNTTWANPTLSTRVKEVLAGRQYMPTDPDLFREVIGGLGIEYPRYTFVDLGSGKGRALLLACEFGFRRIVGVELLPELHRVAAQNARRFRKGTQRQRIELWCGDARSFRFPPEPLVVFLFDPFPELILAEVIAHLERSLSEQPRPALIVYQNPISEHVLSGATWLERVKGDVRAAVYRAR